MNDLLSDRLNQCKTELNEIKSMLDKNPDTLIDRIKSWITEIISSANELDQSIELIKMREQIFTGMTRIDSADFRDESVDFAGFRLPFPTARLMMVQSYLVTNWSISDKISRITGRILLKDDVLKNRAQAFDFVSLFIGRKGKNALLGDVYLSASIRHNFGWPIALLYTIRNHFVHDGGTHQQWDFFTDNTPLSGFSITHAAWDEMKDRVEKFNNIQEGDCSKRFMQKSGNLDNFREILGNCEVEMDEALGIVITSAFSLLKKHVELLNSVR